MQNLYKISGKVEQGKRRGKLLGFPTANIKIIEEIPEGIYISRVMIDKKIYMASTFVGAAKTFNETEFLLESHILDFDKNIYGKKITVNLIKKIRDNKFFENKELLINQMEEDVKITRKYFEKK